MDCTCATEPHELWCPQGTRTLTIGDVRNALSRYVKDGYDTKKVAIGMPDGTLMAAKSVKIGFVRGEFLMVIDAERLQ